MKIPTHEKAAERVIAGKATPLDAFIYENEPVEDHLFRKRLIELLEWHKKQVLEEVI